MGWSCTSDAGHALDTIFNQCYEQTKIQNAYIGTDGMKHFIETSRKEYDDGHITGTIYRYDAHDSRFAYRAGSFRIDEDGHVSRYPAHWPFPKQ